MHKQNAYSRSINKLKNNLQSFPLQKIKQTRSTSVLNLYSLDVMVFISEGEVGLVTQHEE